MGHKTNPIALRLQTTGRQFDQAWYSDHQYADLVLRDLDTQRYVETMFRHLKCPQPRVALHHLPGESQVYVMFCYPRTTREVRARMFHIPTGLPQPGRLPRPAGGTRRAVTDLALWPRLAGEEGAAPAWLYQAALSGWTWGMMPTRGTPTPPSLARFVANLYTHRTGLGAPGERGSMDARQVMDALYGHESGTGASTGHSPAPSLPALQAPIPLQRYVAHHVGHSVGVPHRLAMIRVPYDWQDARYLADEIVYLLERRVSFARIRRRVLDQVAALGALQGLRVTCSGRIGGRSKKAQRAKIQSVKWGQTSLHVYRARIDFAARTASTPFGAMGVKVWVCYRD